MWHEMSLSHLVTSILLDQIFRRTVSDLTNRVYYFESTTSPSIIWGRLDELDFTVGAPIKKIDLVNGTDRVGNVSSEFESTEPFEWAKPMTNA